MKSKFNVGDEVRILFKATYQNTRYSIPSRTCFMVEEVICNDGGAEPSYRIESMSTPWPESSLMLNRTRAEVVGFEGVGDLLDLAGR